MRRPPSRVLRAVAVLAVLPLGLAPPPRPATAAAAAAEQKRFAGCESARRSELLRKVLPSVVSITTRKGGLPTGSGSDAGGATAGPTGAYGSGFIVDPSGVIATNFHVVRDAWEISVIFNDGSQAPAHLLRATQLIDIALLKVDVDRPLPAIAWGDSTALQVGEPVLAIGNALDVGISVSGGLVSALNRNIGVSAYDDFVQTDAAINHGNSGGPLVDMNGEVIGIDTAIFSPTDSSSGVGFAISSRGARIVIERLMQYGWIRPGWIGMKVQQLTREMSAALGGAVATGSLVASVIPDGPAAQAGLRVGDVVLSVGDIMPTDERALLRAIAETPIGRTVSLGIWRDGRAQSLRATVSEWPRAQWERFDPPVSMVSLHHHVPPDLGLDLAPLSEAGRFRDDLAAIPAGVLVRGVAPRTDAAERGLAEGDVILRVGDTPVASPAEARAALAAARGKGRPFVLVLVDPREHGRFPGPRWMVLHDSDY